MAEKYFEGLKKNDKVCILCGKRARIKTLIHRNEHIPENFQFHSDCVKSIIVQDPSKIIEICRMMNVPYIDTLWKQTLESVVGIADEAFSKYLRLVGPRKEYATFMDSEFEDDIKNSDDITEEVISRWGLGYEDDEYRYFEGALNNLQKLKMPKTKLEEEQYITTVLLQKRARDVIKDNDINGTNVKNFQEAYEKALISIGLDSKSVGESKADKGFGTMIKEWEEEGPLPDPGKEFHDVDRIGVYFNKYVLTPLLRNFDKATDEDIRNLNNYSDDDIPGADIYGEDE